MKKIALGILIIGIVCIIVSVTLVLLPHSSKSDKQKNSEQTEIDKALETITSRTQEDKKTYQFQEKKGEKYIFKSSDGTKYIVDLKNDSYITETVKSIREDTTKESSDGTETE